MHSTILVAFLVLFYVSCASSFIVKSSQVSSFRGAEDCNMALKNRRFRRQSQILQARKGDNDSSKSNVVGKKDLIDLIASNLNTDTSQYRINKGDVEMVIEAFFNVVEEKVLEDGNQIQVRSFGTFKQKKSVERVGRNPKTGEEINIPAQISLSFAPSSTMKIKLDSKETSKK